MADKGETQAAEEPADQEKPLSRAELVARAKTQFEMVQKVRMFGALKMHEALATHLGLPASRLSVEKLQRLDQICKRADISRGSCYVERGLVYGCSIYETEMGWRVGYRFLCPNKDDRDGETIVT